MKPLIFFLGIVSATISGYRADTCKPQSFNFFGDNFYFPATVEQAVKAHDLQFKPPGYYYKLNQSVGELILDYHDQDNDFDNEYQPRETLFPRNLHSYIFRFPEKENTYDSLKTTLETQFGARFELVRGLKEGETLLPHERPFEYNFLKVNDCLTVGIKRSPPSRKTKTVTVRFMYNLSLGRMGTVMGSY